MGHRFVRWKLFSVTLVKQSRFIYLFVLFNAMTILEASAISVFKSVKMIINNKKKTEAKMEIGFPF